MTEQKIDVRREKEFLYLRREDGKEVRFNLRTGNIEREYGGYWSAVEHQHHFFRYYSSYHLKFEEKKFEKLLSMAKSMSKGKSISTYLKNFARALKMESFILEGVKFAFKVHHGYRSSDSYSVEMLEHALQEYDKNVIKFFKKYDLEITCTFEKAYFRNPDKIKSFLAKLDATNDRERVRNIGLKLIESRYFSEFMYIVTNYGCDPNSLAGYLLEYLETFENLQVNRSIQLLMDYYRMARIIGREVKKYPKYLHSMHDIITANHNAFIREYDEVEFARIAKTELEAESEEFCVMIPKESKDIIREGTELNHCVSSYVDRILKGETYIMFMRLTKEKDRARITLELKDNKIVQAAGSYNRPLEQEEKKYLERYCREKKLQLATH
jgi:hypothetical protein